MGVEREAAGLAVIVTGASSGIGAAIAGLVGANGFPVAVNFKTNETAAAQVVREIESSGGRAVAIRCDVSREEEIIQLFETAERELGKIGGLVNNAAVTGGFTRVEDLRADAIAQVLAVNVAGTMLCSREAVRRMSVRNGGMGGSIVNISSVSARTGGAEDWVHYAASKGGMNGLIRTAALEYARQNITVNGIEPGYIRTPAMDALGGAEALALMASQIPVGKLGDPVDIAAAAVYLASPAGSFLTGKTLEVDGGLTFPNLDIPVPDL